MKLEFYVLFYVGVKFGSLRVFENRVLRRIFRPNVDEVQDLWTKSHHEERHNLYSSPCIVRVVRSRAVRQAGHVACMGKLYMHTEFLSKFL
jgi:hypothetical protein